MYLPSLTRDFAIYAFEVWRSASGEQCTTQRRRWWIPQLGIGWKHVGTPSTFLFSPTSTVIF